MKWIIESQTMYDVSLIHPSKWKVVQLLTVLLFDTSYSLPRYASSGGLNIFNLFIFSSLDIYFENSEYSIQVTHIWIVSFCSHSKFWNENRNFGITIKSRRELGIYW